MLNEIQLRVLEILNSMKRIHIEWEKINKSAGIIIGILLAIGIVVILYKKGQFMNDYKFTTGRIIEVNAPVWKGAGDYAVIYKYEIGIKFILIIIILNFVIIKPCQK